MESTGNMSRGNMLSGAEAMVRMLQAYDVKHIFGLCGDTTLPFYDALARLDHDIVHYLTRDERHAAYMADGYARVTGKPGICEGPSGAGPLIYYLDWLRLMKALFRFLPSQQMLPLPAVANIH